MSLLQALALASYRNVLLGMHQPARLPFVERCAMALSEAIEDELQRHGMERMWVEDLFAECN